MSAPLLKPVWTYDDVVTALGGWNGVAKITRQPPHAVKAWQKQRGKFPTKYYFAMKGALADAGYRVSLDLFGFFSEASAFRGPRQAA
jgi:hypothetical protein